MRTTSVLSQMCDEEHRRPVVVIPAKAGIHRDVFGPTPPLDARFRGHDDVSFADKIFTELPTQDNRGAVVQNYG